jgi:hypothetical protein
VKDILETMDKMKQNVHRKLENIYQMVLDTKRRNKIKEMMKQKKEKLLEESENQQKHLNSIDKSKSMSKNDKEGQRRRSLFQSGGYRNRKLQLPRSLSSSQPDLYDFGNIGEEDQNFSSLNSPYLDRGAN